MDCADCGLYFIDVLSTFPSRPACFVNDVGFVDVWQSLFVKEVDSDKPVTAFMPWAIGICC